MKPKLKTILVASLVPCAALAGDWRDGDAKFSTKPNRAETLVVSWMVVADSDVQATCEAVSKDRGLEGFGYGVAACSFWTNTTCTIVTSKMPTQYQLGHELRHCFEHSFHQ